MSNHSCTDNLLENIEVWRFELKFISTKSVFQNKLSTKLMNSFLPFPPYIFEQFSVRSKDPVRWQIGEVIHEYDLKIIGKITKGKDLSESFKQNCVLLFYSKFRF